MSGRGASIFCGIALIAMTSGFSFLSQAHAQSVTNWNGFYIGPTVGGTFGSSSGDYTGIAVPPPPPPPAMVYYPFDLKPSGATLGALFGYNYQYARWLFGIEGDLSWIVNANDQAFDPAGSGRYDKIDLLWTAHARAHRLCVRPVFDLLCGRRGLCRYAQLALRIGRAL
jgi:hypothetical protein